MNAPAARVPSPAPEGAATSVVTEATLAAFGDAWNRHDIDALMSFMTEDCVFETAAGPDACGTRHVGAAAVRKAFASAWETVPDARWRDARHHVMGDFGVSEWTFTGTAVDGSRIEVHGVDLFTFRDGRIALKNVFRKARPNLPAARA
jgi:ketosteroid isomerase-like protein